MIFAVVNGFEQFLPHDQHLLGSQGRAVVVGGELRADRDRVVEERAAVGERRAAVHLLVGAEETLGGVQLAAVGERCAVFEFMSVEEGVDVVADIEAFVERQSPAADPEGELAHAGLFPRVAETAVALGREQSSQFDVEIEEGVEPHADAGVEQLQVDDVFDRRALLSRIVEHRVVEPVVERVEVVASGEQDAELFAREGRVHALPVADELDVGVPFSVVLRQHAVHAVVEEAFRLGEECRRIVVVVHHVAREDTGRGRHLGRLELVVEDGFDLRKIGRFLGSEILDHVRGDDQRVFLVPPDADTGRQPGREVRARFDVQSRHGELVAAEFLVVEIHFEIGSQQNLLCVSCGDASGKGEQE